MSASQAIYPKDPDALYAYAFSLHQAGNIEEAIPLYQQLHVEFPNHSDLLTLYGTALLQAKNLPDGIRILEKSIQLFPNQPIALSNIANGFYNLKQFETSILFCDKSIAIDQNYPAAHNNRADALMRLNRFEEALISCERAIALKPHFAHAYWNKSLIKLVSGDYEEGWDLYEWRWRSIFKDKVRTFEQPLWLGGESISGKTILIYEEQGLGDVIQMSRYISMLSALGANVILEVPESLFSVMSTLREKVSVIKTGAKLPDFDFQCPIMSLPLAFKTEVGNIPSNTPYLYVDKVKQKLWRAILGEKTKPRIGLVCSGSISHKNDNKRSLSIELFGALFDLPFEFHILQKEIRPNDTAALRVYPHVRVYNEELVDFSDTAAVINEMDLIISVDTSVAHLAGALNKPVWILLSYLPDFRWLLDRSDSPWYPTARLFRQSRLDEWEGVINDVCQKLQMEYAD